MKSQFEDVKSLVWPFTGPSHRLDPKKLSMEQKDWLGAKINNGDFTTVELSYRFKIGVRTLRKYALNLRKGIPNYGFGGGRPPMISKAASATLARKLRRSSYQVDEKEYQEAIIQAQRDTAIEFKKDPDMVEPLSRHALARVEKREDISAGFAEVGTNARDENELCVRNAVTFAAMNKVMSELARPPLIMNADGTLFTIYGADSRTRVRFIGKRPKNLKAKARKKGEENNLRYGVKYLCLMSAGGHMAAPVFVVADDNMKKEAISVQEIPGLNFTLGCAIGYLVFCNTRVCNHAFYEWVVKTLLLDFVKEIKKIYKFDDDDVTWFQLDGEAVQIEPYLNNTILDLLEQAKVVVGKPPASTTAITQACDVGNVFRSSKSCLKTLTDEDVPMEGPLFDALKAGIKAHEAYVNHKLKSGIEKKAITAIMRSFHALTRVVSSHTIRESFKACGVYPFSVGQILKQCKAELDETTKTVIKESLNGLAEIMKINGQLTEADLSAAGIGHTVPANKKNKNENVITKRRSVFLTNRLIVDAEVERRRQIALDKELKATKKTTRARKGPAVPKANAPAIGGV